MKKVLLFVVMFTGATVCSAQNTFYFPQIADGISGGIFWKTTIYLTNPAPPGTSAGSIVFSSGAITFMNDNGGAFNVEFVDTAGNSVSAGNTIPFQIAGGQTRKFVSRGVAPLTTGFATVSSNLPVAGTAIFSLFNANGSLISEAGVAATQATTSQLIVVDTLGGFNTGVAYANPNLGAAGISLQLLSSQGVVVMPSTNQTLPPNGHDAKFVTQMFNPAPPPFNGTMRITSASPLAVVALRFDPTFTFFTTLPSISIAALLPSTAEWFQHRPWLTPLTSLAQLLGGLLFRLG